MSDTERLLGDRAAMAALRLLRDHGYTSEQVFARRWDRIHGLGTWERNDWVWVVEYRRTEQDGEA